MKKTGIIATVGPSSINFIKELSKVSIFRLNFSHGNYEDHLKAIKKIKEANNLGCDFKIMQDLQGPKFRIGKFKNNSVILQKNDIFTLDTYEDLGDSNRVNFKHRDIYDLLKKDSLIFLNDGKITLKVLESNQNTIKTIVEVGGMLSNFKGVNLPDITINTVSLTYKDKKDLEFGLKNGIDIVALSFVQNKNDILNAKEYIRKIIGENSIKVVAKIETKSAVKNIDDILKVSDMIMVARGDLGIEIGVENVPKTTKHIINECNKRDVKVIVATHMLESMIENSIPTRAEVSDVANAVYDGADYVMLSAESATGNYPIEAVNMMHKIIKATN